MTGLAQWAALGLAGAALIWGARRQVRRETVRAAKLAADAARLDSLLAVLADCADRTARDDDGLAGSGVRR